MDSIQSSDRQAPPDAAVNKTISYKSALSASHQDSKSALDAYKKKMKEKAEAENSTLWQHPFVDVFKHFKIIPGSDWKQNKKQGDVQEYFAKEIGRKALNIQGSISANNYIQVPNPQSPLKNLGLTGRYAYLQIKSPMHGQAFSFHLDLTMAERSHGIRISVSNLFKNFNTSNGFVAQIPLELKNNCWTVVVLDLYDLLKKSNILPTTYLIEGSYQIRSFNICANSHIRGIFTSDSLYDFVTLPADMRFKFAFDLGKWMEYFDWQTLPHDWTGKRRDGESGDENKNLQNLIDKSKNTPTKPDRESQRVKMRQEIDDLLLINTQQEVGREEPNKSTITTQQEKYADMQRQLTMQFNGGPADHPVSGYIIKDDDESQMQQPSLGPSGGIQKRSNASKTPDYVSGQYSGYELTRSHKLNKDPIMELKHIIGFQPDMCRNLKWSRYEGENVILFSSGGTLIAMDTETNQQTRFFFGHSAPICCFDINMQGNLIASAQDGKNSIIRIWDYFTARCITMMTMPVKSLICISFSHDGRYIACSGKTAYSKEASSGQGAQLCNKELICIWDISKVQRGEKPELVAKQTSDWSILSLKFSPIDVTRLCSCGKENIRFWRVRDSMNIRGSAVVLNHHARNTVFTSLDFEYGFRSADKDENEALKRVFVGSKTGMIFQINYQSEQLEASFKTNDGAIFSISVNDAFCVVGSEDSYLRVWPLDFQEFFMEAQHEGTVGVVDISPDGLKVACGTLYGSIGILDKSNLNYKTLLRSHTDDIIDSDFHLQKQSIITISTDRSIRLWDIETFDEVYEFTSPKEQPLCVAAHPNQPIFACGFEEGKMSLFDIENTEVFDDFQQFNKDLKALKYDYLGKILVACCVDGSVSIHNAQRKHLPIKMMHLTYPPEFIHVAFTERPQTVSAAQTTPRFAVMGEYGNNIVIYDTDSFLLVHQLMIQNIVRSFQFANNNRDLLVVTKDCKVRFYSLMKYEGIFLREIANCHRGSISGMDVSLNTGYLLTGGEDNMVKIWDYEAQKTVPYYFQSFIGHTYPITKIIFNPRNNGQIISIGKRDGIFIWDFNGDIESDYKFAQLAGQDLQSISTVETKEVSMLEKIRTQHKQKKVFRNQIAESTFIVPQFKPIEQVAIENNRRDFVMTPNTVNQHRAEHKLQYNHYVGCSKKLEIELEQQALFSIGGGESNRTVLPLKLMNGYDGYGGVHDNMLWNAFQGFTYFTLNNKLIVENTKTREQTVWADSHVQLSCLAASNDGKYIAVGEGVASTMDVVDKNLCSLILLYDLEKKRLVQKLSFHQKGIQSLAFTYDTKYLISLGVHQENTLAVWDITSSSGLVISTMNLGEHPTNQIRMDPFVQGSHIQFITVGNNACLQCFRMDLETRKLENFDVEIPESIRDRHFLCADFTHPLPDVGTYYTIIGADDGTLITYNMEENEFVNVNNRQRLCQGQVGCLSIKGETIVAADQQGMLVHYRINGSQITPDDPDELLKQDVKSAVVSVSMIDGNNEGLIGTEAGCIHYVNFMDNVCIKLVQTNNQNQDAVSICQIDSGNNHPPLCGNIFITNCGSKSDELKIFTANTCDMVHNFQGNLDEDGHVVFVISGENWETKRNTKRNLRLVGFSHGVIKRISIDNLAIDDCYKLPMSHGERLTCGFFCSNEFGKFLGNFLIGTNMGTLFIGSLNKEKKRVTIDFTRIENVGMQNQFDNQAQNSSNPNKMNLDILPDDQSLDNYPRSSQDDLYANYVGITNVCTHQQDPIGTIMCSFDDGSVKVWVVATRADVLMKMMEINQKDKNWHPKEPARATRYDISEVGYQQFDQVDSFDIFENPHNEDIDAQEKAELKAMYSGKKYPMCSAVFTPGLKMTDQYFAWVDSLPYIFMRNYKERTITKKINLQSSNYPTCLSMTLFKHIELDEDAVLKKGTKDLLVSIGTRNGKILVYRVGEVSQSKLFQSKSGMAYGAITAVSIDKTGEHLVAASESGEIMTYQIKAKLNAEE